MTHQEMIDQHLDLARRAADAHREAMMRQARDRILSDALQAQFEFLAGQMSRALTFGALAGLLFEPKKKPGA